MENEATCVPFSVVNNRSPKVVNPLCTYVVPVGHKRSEKNIADGESQLLKLDTLTGRHLDSATAMGWLSRFFLTVLPF